jgi:putative nucleotidyltransferase with HDIG domain
MGKHVGIAGQPVAGARAGRFEKPVSRDALRAALLDHGGKTVAALEATAAAGEPLSKSELVLLGELGELIAQATKQPAARGSGSASIGDFHHKLPAAFERLEGLPALNESRDALLRVLAEPAASADAIVAAIESDVALLIAVLRLANQAADAKQPSIWSVAEAVSVLTPEGVEALARRITVFDFFQRIRGWTVPPEHFRLHAVMTQRAAQRLARAIDHPDADRLVVAALLHDVGKLVLIEAYPGYPDEVVDPAQTPEERLIAERRQLGVDHEMAGGVLLRRWRMPERLAELVARHHTGRDDPDAALLRLADALGHYSQGRPVQPGRLSAAAAEIGLSPEQLRTIMYELLGGEGPMRFRSVEASPLSARQTELMRELAKGKSYKQIAAGLGLSVSTVRTHFYNAYQTLGVNNRAQAVLMATERGWI